MFCCFFPLRISAETSLALSCVATHPTSHSLTLPALQLSVPLMLGFKARGKRISKANLPPLSQLRHVSLHTLIPLTHTTSLLWFPAFTVCGFVSTGTPTRGLRQPHIPQARRI